MIITESRNRREGRYAGRWLASELKAYPGMFFRPHPNRHRRSRDRVQPLRFRGRSEATQ